MTGPEASLPPFDPARPDQVAPSDAPIPADASDAPRSVSFAEAAAPAEPPPAHRSGEPPAPLPLGVGTFTIEGRQAPALFVVGWLATLVGLGLLVVGLLGGGGAAAIVLLASGLASLSLGLFAGAGSQAIERRARGGAAYTGPSPFLVFAAVIPLTILLQAIVFVPLVALGLDAGSPVAALIGLLVTAAVYLGLIRLLVVGPGGLSWREMGASWPGRRAGLIELTYGAMLGVPLLVVTGLLALLLSQFLATPEGALPEAAGPLGALVNLASAALVAPIAEEIFFRGYSTTAWLRGIGADRAVVRGAIFFAAAHVITVGGASFGEGAERALFAFVVRLPVALALGWVFVRRGSLVAAIGMHAAYNGIPVLALLLSSG